MLIITKYSRCSSAHQDNRRRGRSIPYRCPALPQQFLKFTWRPKRNHRSSAHCPTAAKKEGTHIIATGHETSRETKHSTGKNLGLRFLSKDNNYHVPLGLCTENEVMLKTTAVKFQSQVKILHGKISQSNSGRTFLNSPTLDSAETPGKKMFSSLPWKGRRALPHTLLKLYWHKGRQVGIRLC